jgi:hypothetical protein
MSYYPFIFDFTETISSAKQKMPKFNTICEIIERDLQLSFSFDELDAMAKKVEEYTDRLRTYAFKYNIEKDRVFPLDEVEIQKYQFNHERKLENARIHIGPDADAYARTLNALAVTIGHDIFFRDTAFNTGSGEGKKTLAHELTHVSQAHEEKALKKEDHEIYEREAEAVENSNEEDEYVLVKVRNKYCKMRSKEYKGFVKETAEQIMENIKHEKLKLGEENYLKLLCVFERRLRWG